MGSRNLVWGAASSSASGTPSSRQQIAAIAAAFAWVSSKAEEASSARLMKSPAASRSRRSRTPNFGASFPNVLLGDLPFATPLAYQRRP